jgi:hypothetical protein
MAVALSIGCRDSAPTTPPALVPASPREVEPSIRAVPELRSLSHVLRDGGFLNWLSEKDRLWMTSSGGWTEADLEELQIVLVQTRTGQEGWDGTGVDGLTKRRAEGELGMRALVALERNGLLADFVDRGEVDRVRDFVRNRRRNPPKIQDPWERDD